MRSVALMVLASGCFYVDPINQRPSIDIVQHAGTVHRGDLIDLDSKVDDPEGQFVQLTWHAQACEADGVTCDPAFFSRIDPRAEILVPGKLMNGHDVGALVVELDAIDAYGATAKPNQTVVITVEDRPPTMTTSKSSRYGYVVGTPVDVYARVGDKDDPLSSLMIDASPLSPPSQPSFTFTALPDKPDPADSSFHIYGWELVPQGIGDWDVQVTATDPDERDPQKMLAPVVQHVPITIVPDHAPCLAQWSPIAAPPGQALPISDPTLFQVLVVQDDLDPYPVASDPLMGLTTFHWSIEAPGATTHTPLATTDNKVALDPASYAPGDVVELRVEIEDRNQTPVPCADDQPTCSINADPTCIQRLTWRVVIQ